MRVRERMGQHAGARSSHGPSPLRRATGCDVSPSALQTLRRRADEMGICPGRLVCRDLDLEAPASEPGLGQASFQAVLLVFTLSALSPDGQARALRLAASTLAPGGRVLVRDYGIFDMVHLRFLERTGRGADGGCRGSLGRGPSPDPPTSFMRDEGTRAAFFSLQDLEQLAAAAGLQAEQARYACVLASRRSGAPPLRRVFVHLVLRRADGRAEA